MEFCFSMGSSNLKVIYREIILGGKLNSIFRNEGESQLSYKFLNPPVYFIILRYNRSTTSVINSLEILFLII
jgi:hypothetical protein